MPLTKKSPGDSKLSTLDHCLQFHKTKGLGGTADLDNALTAKKFLISLRSSHCQNSPSFYFKEILNHYCVDLPVKQRTLGMGHKFLY